MTSVRYYAVILRWRNTAEGDIDSTLARENKNKVASFCFESDMATELVKVLL